MRKKLFCFLAAMVMILGLVACSNSDGDGNGGSSDSGKSDFDAFMEVQKNMQGIKDAEFKMNQDMNITVSEDSEEENLSSTITATCKEVFNSKDDVQLEMKYKMSLPMLSETSMEGTAYMKDGNIYMDLFGEKVKVDASDEMAAMMQIDTNKMLGITEEMVADLKVDTADGNTTYSFKLEPTKVIDYFKSNFSNYEDIAELDLTFENMDVVVTTDESQMVKKIDIDCNVVSHVEEDADVEESYSTPMTYKTSVEYLSYNTGLKINFPDLSDYEETSL